ncbi:MAG: hypothetical protein R3D26_12610 [Cyanobacteriota/Melainabacteria group bacterium]
MLDRVTTVDLVARAIDRVFRLTAESGDEPSIFPKICCALVKR